MGWFSKILDRLGLTSHNPELGLILAKAKAAATLIESNSNASALEGYFTLALHSVQELRAEPNYATIEDARHNLRVLCDLLDESAKADIGIGRAHFDSFVDRIYLIWNELKEMPPTHQKHISDIVLFAGLCLKLLKETVFVNRYQKQLNELIDP